MQRQNDTITQARKQVAEIEGTGKAQTPIFTDKRDWPCDAILVMGAGLLPCYEQEERS